MNFATQQGPNILLRITVRPGSLKNEIKGIWNDMLKVSLQAPPERGRANEALIAFFAITLKISRSAISIQTGATSQNKILLIQNYTLDQLLGQLKLENG